MALALGDGECAARSRRGQVSRRAICTYGMVSAGLYRRGLEYAVRLDTVELFQDQLRGAGAALARGAMGMRQIASGDQGRRMMPVPLTGAKTIGRIYTTDCASILWTFLLLAARARTRSAGCFRGAEARIRLSEGIQTKKPGHVPGF